MKARKMSKKPTKLIQTVRIKPSEAEELKGKAWELTIKAEEVIQEPEIVHFLIDEFINDIDVKDGKLTRKS
ncbi:TPA: hypothetical protein I6187_003391 [Vibrio cholerae]|uniref:hypothetical protein n=1 Tax=Vibrio cholerae TaxID=666 RepID=UPI00061607F9|nr:hypothetical protein [Vibrio cholerae]AKB03046.1 hypothetical protein VAA049_1331 [Vibrio cholerae]AKB03499.1 hypothetical protein VAA049_1348 [Vibrio cholerae]AKB03957.1 hypothetical protein VAA049_1339 [Vibrio cholerae]TYA66612.1 hypothetical protein FXE18_08370 [Vibrio cholerae]GIB88543.1 hypothetical protein VCSRO49_2123 [Vibrio cholerae]